MSRYDTYSVYAAEAPTLRRWMVVTFFLSVGLHGALFLYLNSARVEGLVFNEQNLKLTKPVHLKRVTIPQMPEEKAPAPVLTKTSPTPVDVTLPADKPVVSEIHVSPAFPDLGAVAFKDKPLTDSTLADRLAKSEANARQQMDKQISSNLG